MTVFVFSDSFIAIFMKVIWCGLVELFVGKSYQLPSSVLYNLLKGFSGSSIL